MDKRRQMVYAILICPECELRMTVPRKKCKQKEYHHVKSMYCAMCRMEQQFVEHKEYELMMAI